MALLFSAVTVTANDQEVEFLVGGIPREFDDLEGWTAFDSFMKRIEMDDTFLSRCDNIEDVDFNFQWSPEELFDMEVN